MPGVLFHSQYHCLRVSVEYSAARFANCHGPSSTRTSTDSMPRCCAQATPATTTRPGFSRANPAGTSMLDEILIGAWAAHPRSVQYADALSKRVISCT